jgi:3-oxoadipate enol-lactonase
VTLHYRIDGPGEGIPLILLNGLFADLHSWDGAMAHLKDFRVLRYDGRGQGCSPSPEGIYDLATLLGDLLEVLDEAAFPSAHVVGISNGGCLGLELAAATPARVRRLVAADCYLSVSPLSRLKIQSWLLAHETGGPTHRFDIAAPWVWSEATLADNREAIAAYREKATSHSDRAVQGLLRGALSHQIDGAAIVAETLLLAGSEDLLTPPFCMRAMAEILRAARFQEVAGAHASLLEYPHIFAETIVPFLREDSHVD